MIQRLSHVTVWVLDQDAAYDFYVNKLGFDVHTDAKMDNGFRWLTVTSEGPARPGDRSDAHSARSDDGPGDLRRLARAGPQGHARRGRIRHRRLPEDLRRTERPKAWNSASLPPNVSTASRR